MRRIGIAVAAFAALAVLAAALLGGRGSHDILLTEVIAAPVEGREGEVAVFLTISNTGAPDRLLGVSSEAAAAVALDLSDAPEGIPVPAGGDISLAPDSAHIRLSGVEGSLADGRLLPVTLTFGEAGRVTARARLVAPLAEGEAAAYGLLGMGGICLVEGTEPAPAISVSAEPAEGGGWRVAIAAEEFEFRRELMDGPHIPGTGHGHLYVGGAKVGRLFAPEAEIGRLPPGRHTIRVTLNTNDHRTYVVGDEAVSRGIEVVAD